LTVCEAQCTCSGEVWQLDMYLRCFVSAADAAAAGVLSASAAQHDAVATARAELAAQVEALREQLGHAQVGSAAVW
jgi:hypothetical protein